VLLIVLGVLLLGAGVAGVLVGSGVFGRNASTTPLITDSMRAYAHHHAGWYWGGIAGGSVLVTALALWWLIAQSGSSRVSSLQLEVDRSHGITRLMSSAVTTALADEVAAYHGVDDASARILGSPRQPLLRLDVALDDSADIGAVRERVETQAVPRVRQAVSVSDLPIWLRLEIAVSRRGREVL
jgi:hypothetical protein